MSSPLPLPNRLISSPRSAVVLLLTINMFNYIDRYVLAAVVPLVKQEFFAADNPDKDFWMGMLATAFLLSYMVMAPVFGWLADRMSRWLIIGVGVIIWSLASGASGLASAYAALLISRLFVGVGEAAYGPSAPTIIADMYPVNRRGSVLAWFYMAIPVGSALGYAAGGWIAKTWDWRMAFYASVPPGILLGILALVRRDPARGASDSIAMAGGAPVTHRMANLGDYRTFLKTPSYVLNTLGMTAMTFALGGIAYWMPTYIHEFRGVENLGQVNMMFGAITVAAGLSATLLGGIVGDRLRPRYSGSYFLVSGIGMLLGLPMFVAVLFIPFPMAWVFIFLAEFCLFFNTGPTNTVIANVTHPAVRSSAYAVNILMIHLLGDAISPPLMGAITDHFGGNMNAGFSVVTAAIFLAGFFWLQGIKHLARDTDLAPTRLSS